MRAKPRTVIAISLFIVAGAVLIGGILSILLTYSESSNQATQLAGNNIVRENTYPGTTDWEITDGRGASTEIQAYAGAVSVWPGQKLTFLLCSTPLNRSHSLNRSH